MLYIAPLVSGKSGAGFKRVRVHSVDDAYFAFVYFDSFD